MERDDADGRCAGVGTANYRQLLAARREVPAVAAGHALFVALAVPLSQVAALGVAMLMNTRVRGIAAFRTIYFVPSLIVASVVGAVLWMQMLNKDYGLINAMLRPIAALFGTTPPDWLGQRRGALGDPRVRPDEPLGRRRGDDPVPRGPKGIPISLYEAATIDGAGQLRKFWNVTLPMLSPLIFYNLVMGIIAQLPGLRAGDGDDRRRAERPDALLRAEPVQPGVRVPQHGLRERDGVGAVSDPAGVDGAGVQGVEEPGVLRGAEDVRRERISIPLLGLSFSTMFDVEFDVRIRKRLNMNIQLEHRHRMTKRRGG